MIRRFRSAISGRFVSRGEAEAHPDVSVSESRAVSLNRSQAQTLADVLMRGAAVTDPERRVVDAFLQHVAEMDR